MDMKKTVLLTGLAAALFFIPGIPGLVDAQPRWVLVNGIPQNPIPLSTLDRYACTVIPNGSYWLDYNTGIWGYAGNPRPMGRIGDACNPSSSSGRPSLSERGMLYSSQPWGRGR